MSENDSCCCSCSATKPAVTLNVKQEALAEALYQAYRRNFYGQENNPLNMADWGGASSPMTTPPMPCRMR